VAEPGRIFSCKIGRAHAEFVRLMRAAESVRECSSDPVLGRVRITIGTREQMKQA